MPETATSAVAPATSSKVVWTSAGSALADEPALLSEPTLPDLTMPVLVDALTEPTLPDLSAPNTEALAEPVGPEPADTAAAQVFASTAVVEVESAQGMAAESAAILAESSAGSAHGDGDKAVSLRSEVSVTTPGVEFAEPSAVGEVGVSPVLAADGAAPPRTAAEARQEETPQVAPPAGGAVRVELAKPVRTFRPTQLDNLESLVEPPKPRRAGGIVAAVAALGLVAAVLFFALRSGVKDKSAVGLESVQSTHEVAAAGEAKPAVKQTQPAPTEGSPNASANQGEGPRGAKLSNAFATAIKSAENDEKPAPVGDTPRGAKDEPSTPSAEQPAAKAEPEQRDEAAQAVAETRRPGVTKVTIRAVPNDADIFNHRGRRVGVGTAEVEVAPRAKYTYTVLRRFYKPGKITVTDRAPEIVVELQKAPAR